MSLPIEFQEWVPFWYRKVRIWFWRFAGADNEGRKWLILDWQISKWAWRKLGLPARTYVNPDGAEIRAENKRNGVVPNYKPSKWLTVPEGGMDLREAMRQAWDEAQK